MKPLKIETREAFERRMERAGVPPAHRAAWLKWVAFYLDFCEKYRFAPRDSGSLEPFLKKLAEKGQNSSRRAEAADAVRLLTAIGRVGKGSEPTTPDASGGEVEGRESKSARIREPAGPKFGDETGCPAASWESEFAQLEGAIRMRNYSRKTLEAYRHWVGAFQAFVRSKPPGELSGEDVKAFLTHLAVKKNVAASTQNQAFNALLFFFRHVLGKEFGEVKGVVRAKRRPYVPVTLSKREVEGMLEKIDPGYRLVAGLLYGCGLRLRECVELRVQCVNLDALLLTVHDGKGQKDRSVPLPQRLGEAVADQIEAVRRRHQEDIKAGYAGTFLPKQLEKKYKNAAREFVWQWLFPAATLTHVAAGDGHGEKRRFHIHDSHVQGAVKRAAGDAGIPKRVSPHTFRHSFASHLLLAGYDLPTIQKLLGHGDIKTTMIYVQTVPSKTVREARSPLDLEF